jgi:hypothetical protein
MNLSHETDHTQSGSSPPEVSAPELEHRPRHRLTPPPPAECVRLYRSKYPGALVCITCGTLLATQPTSYAKSNLTKEQSLTYVCGECRWENFEAAKRAEMNRQKLVLARGARAEQAQKLRDAATMPTYSGSPERPAADPHQSVRFSRLNRDGRAYDPARDGGRGRPPVPLAEQRRKARERSRAYRARQMAEVAS